MKNSILLLAIVTLLITGCTQRNGLDGGDCVNSGSDCIAGNQLVATQSIADLPAFSGIQLHTVGQVILQQGTTPAVRIEGEDNLLELFEFTVVDGQLRIDANGCFCTNEKIKFYVTMPSVRGLAVYSSGDITSQGTIESEALSLLVDGSGDIELDIESDAVELKVDGPGDATLTGKTAAIKIAIESSGSANLFDLSTNECKVLVNGSGDGHVSVRQRLAVQLESTGDVHYKGRPEISVLDNGTGDLVDAN